MQVSFFFFFNNNNTFGYFENTGAYLINILNIDQILQMKETWLYIDFCMWKEK